MINSMDRKRSTHLITKDQPKGLQTINLTDHKRSTQWITNDQPNQNKQSCQKKGIKPNDNIQVKNKDRKYTQK